MDLRVRRTKENIIRAFLELRAKKPLERITITELSAAARINKATFYKHYRDIYDLAEQLECEAVETVLNDIPHPEYLVTDIKQWHLELTAAVRARWEMFSILFSGSRQHVLEERMVEGICARVYEVAPAYQTDPAKQMLLSFLIRGSFHTFLAYQNEDPEYVMGLLGDISECLIKNFGDV